MNPAQTHRLYDSAWSQIRNGDLAHALQTSERGLKEYRSVSDWHWRFLVLKAEILMRQGRNEDSLALLNFSFPLAPSNSDSAVWQKLTQGSAFAYLSKFPEAQAALLQAQSLSNQFQPQLGGEALLRLGTLASLQRELSRAESLFHSCLDFARQHNDAYLEASALGSLGLVAARMERYDEAIRWNQQALKLDQENGWLGLAARAEGNIGWSYYLVGDLVNALDFYTKADKHDIEAGVPERRITWLNAQGDVYYDLRDYESARAKSSEALKLAESLRDADDAIYCLQNLALIALAHSQLEAAQNYVEDALRREALAPDHARELYTRLIAANLAARTRDLSKSETLFQQIISDSVSPKSLVWEARAGLAQTHALQGKLDLAEREFQIAIGTISEAQGSIELEDFRLSFLSSAIRFYDEYVNFLLSRNRPLDALAIADRSRAQTLERGLSGSRKFEPRKSLLDAAFLPRDIARRQNATLLFYWLGQEKSYLWTIGPKGVSLFPLPPGPQIEALAKSYRLSFLDPRDPLDSMNGDGQKLYDILIRPAQKLIPANSRVVILPDGKLNGLNFDTLIVNEPRPHYWIEDATITVANSLALLERSSRMPPPNSPGLLLFGDALPATKEFPPLADAQKEIAALEKHFPENRRNLFTGAKAVASNYLSSNPGRYSYIHFATHGTASTSRPLESAIILSPEGEGYKLYARDIVKHPLNAYLVSISACNGVGERQFAGEGLVGLSWAFLRAGAHNVVAGLWEVSTASTPQIMDGLYKGIVAGQDPATALRTSKLSLIHSKSTLSRPFYWAPFQLYSGS